MQPNQLISTKEAYTQPPYPLLNTNQFRNFEILKLSYFIKHAMGRILPFSNLQVAKWATCPGVPRQPTCPRNPALLPPSVPLYYPRPDMARHGEEKPPPLPSPRDPLRITAPCLSWRAEQLLRVLRSSRNRPLPPSPLPFTWQRGAPPPEVHLAGL
jgi:hypothetical protein